MFKTKVELALGAVVERWEFSCERWVQANSMVRLLFYTARCNGWNVLRAEISTGYEWWEWDEADKEWCHTVCPF